MDQSKRMSKRESVAMSNQNVGGNFGSKLTFTVGSAYMGFAAMGLLSGIINIKRPKFALPTKRLVFAYHLKHMASNAVPFANKGASAALLYAFCGMLISTTFEKSLMNWDNMSKNLLVGFSTGVIYKSTRGLRPALVGGLVGTAMVLSLNIVTDWLRERDYINFEMIMY